MRLMSCVLARFMKLRSGNSRVAIMANKDTMEMRNAERAEPPPKRSYVAVVASPRRSTRSNPANVSLSQKSGNARVANPVGQPKASPPPSPERARPVPADDGDFAANPRLKKQEIAALEEEIAKRDVVLVGNAVVANKAPVAGGAKPPSPPAPAPAAGATRKC